MENFFAKIHEQFRSNPQQNREKNFRHWLNNFLHSKIDAEQLQKILDNNIFWNRNISTIADKCNEIIRLNTKIKVYSDLDGVFDVPFYRPDWVENRQLDYFKLKQVLSDQDLTIFSSRIIIDSGIYTYLAIAIKFLTGSGFLRSIPLFLPKDCVKPPLESDDSFTKYPENVLTDLIQSQNTNPKFKYRNKRDKIQRKECIENIFSSLLLGETVVFIGSSIIDREFFKQLVTYIFETSCKDNLTSFFDCIDKLYYLDTNLTIY